MPDRYLQRPARRRGLPLVMTPSRNHRARRADGLAPRPESQYRSGVAHSPDRRLGRFAMLVAAGAALAGGCVRTAARTHDDGGRDVGPAGDLARADAKADLALIAPDTLADGIARADSFPRQDPDAAACPVLPDDFPGVVCFGSDPVVYQFYLQPVDGGWPIGACPAPTDFVPWPGGETCGYVPCGPLAPDSVRAFENADAGTDAATNPACCFWVRHVCGV